MNSEPAAVPGVRILRLSRHTNLTLALTTDSNPVNIDGLHAIRKEHQDLPSAWVIHEQHVTAAPVGTPIYDRIRFFDSTNLKAHLEWATNIGTVTADTLLVKNLENGHPGQTINGNEIRAAMAAYQGAIMPRPQASYGLMKMDQFMRGVALLDRGPSTTSSADSAAAPIIRRDSLALAEFYVGRMVAEDSTGTVSEQEQTAWMLSGLARAMHLNPNPPAIITQPWYHYPGKPWHGTVLTDADIRIIGNVARVRNARVLLCAHVGAASGGAAPEDIAKEVRRWRTVLG